MSTTTDPSLDEKAAKKAAKAAEKEAARQAKEDAAAAKAAAKSGGKKGEGESVYAKTSAKPSINLIPRYITERRAAERTGRQVMYSGLAVLGLCVAVVGFSWSQALGAQQDRSDAEFERDTVQQQVDLLKPIADYYDGLVARQSLALETMKPDLDNSKILDGLYAAAGTGTSIESVDLSKAPPCPGSNPFSITPALGCVTLTAKSNDLAATTGFLTALNADSDLFSSAFSADMGGGENSDGTYTVTVNYSAEALSMRFVPEDQREQVKADIMSAAAAPAVDPVTGQPITPAPTGATP